MMQRRFRTRYLAAVLAAVVCVSTWVSSALASVAYNGTRGLLRTRSADTFHKGTLSFQVAYRPPGPGGAGGGRERVSQCTVTLTADHHARLVTTGVAAPAGPSIE